MRAYVIDCSGDTPAVVDLKKHLHTFVDFGMTTGNNGPPNYLTLASGNLVVAGNSPLINVYFYLLVLAPDGSLVSKTEIGGTSSYFVGLVPSPDDPNTVAIIGDRVIHEVSGLDTPTPVVVSRNLTVPTSAYSAGASSPYYDGPGLIDSKGDIGDPEAGLWAYNLSTFAKSQIGDDNYVEYWPNGNYDLGDGRVAVSDWGQTRADSDAGVDVYSRFFFVDYRTDPLALEIVDVKPQELLPDRLNNPSGDGYMGIDELNVGSTSIAVDGSQGLVVRGSTVLSDAYPEVDTRNGRRYSVAVWTLRGTAIPPGGPMPALAGPVYSAHESVSIPMGDEIFALETYTYIGPPYVQHLVVTSEADSAVNIRVGTPPLLTSADTDTSYLRRDYASGDPSIGPAVVLDAWSVPPERALATITVEFDCYLSVPLVSGLYVRLLPPVDLDWVGVGPISLTVSGPSTVTGWHTYTVTGPINGILVNWLAAGGLVAAIRPQSNTEPVEMRVSRIAVSADLLKAP